jgi:putative transposase
MTGFLAGYARCSTDMRDLTAQREILLGLCVPEDRIYLDRGLTGTNRKRPGLDQALASVRAGDTLVVPKRHGINRKKVERIMRERDIRGVTRRKRRHLTKQDSKAAPAPDLVGRDFTAARPGQKLVGDITYLPTIEGWWYLATVIDLATREVIGYAMAGHHRAELVTDAFRMAAGHGDLKPGCIMHTDRGSQYTSSESRRKARKLSLRQSMGRTGICYDNAAAESFFGLLKAEIGTTVWESREAARADVFRFIEVEYNRTRLRKHPEFGYLTPLETRARLQHDFTPAA